MKILGRKISFKFVFGLSVISVFLLPHAGRADNPTGGIYYPEGPPYRFDLTNDFKKKYGWPDAEGAVVRGNAGRLSSSATLVVIIGTQGIYLEKEGAQLSFHHSTLGLEGRGSISLHLGRSLPFENILELSLVEATTKNIPTNPEFVDGKGTWDTPRYIPTLAEKVLFKTSLPGGIRVEDVLYAHISPPAEGAESEVYRLTLVTNSNEGPLDVREYKFSVDRRRKSLKFIDGPTSVNDLEVRPSHFGIKTTQASRAASCEASAGVGGF